MNLPLDTNEATPTIAPTIAGVQKMPSESGKQRPRTTRPRQQTQEIFTAILDKEAIREALSFEKLMTHYGLEIFPHDKVRCLFHGADKKPSTTIRNNHFYCFTCGESLDAFAFIQAMEHCTFPEALRIGAAIAGVMPERQGVTSRKQIAKVVAERKHDASERHRVILSCDRKYAVLASLAAKMLPYAPDWLPKLDSLLDDWIHAMPDYVDLRPLILQLAHAQCSDARHLENIEHTVTRLYEEQQWRATHAE